MNAMTKTTVDVGTSQRSERQGGLRLGARIQTDAGIVMHQGAAANVECLLDALYQDRVLDGREGTKADRASVGRNRYDQGVWLRRLFMDAGLQQARAADLNSKGGKGDDVSERVAQKRAEYNAVIRSLGVYGPSTTAAVCYDQPPKNVSATVAMKQGLDLLCVKRG